MTSSPGFNSARHRLDGSGDTRGNEDFAIRIGADAVLPLQFAGDGLAQRGNSVGAVYWLKPASMAASAPCRTTSGTSVSNALREINAAGLFALHRHGANGGLRNAAGKLAQTQHRRFLLGRDGRPEQFATCPQTQFNRPVRPLDGAGWRRAGVAPYPFIVSCIQTGCLAKDGSLARFRKQGTGVFPRMFDSSQTGVTLVVALRRERVRIELELKMIFNFIFGRHKQARRCQKPRPWPICTSARAPFSANSNWRPRGRTPDEPGFCSRAWKSRSLRSGPGGDPRVYRVEGTEVAMRRDLSRHIHVRAARRCRLRRLTRWEPRP